MKLKNIFFLFLAFFVGLNACKDDDLTPAINVDDFIPPTIRPLSQASFVLEREQAASPLFTLEWDPVVSSSSVPLAAPSYNIELDLAGNNFANPVVVASTGSTSASVITGELNSRLTAKNMPVGTAGNVEFRVLATIPGTTLRAVSAPVTLELTPFEASVEIVLDPTRVGVLGSAVNGWDEDVDLFPLTPDETDVLSRVLYLKQGEMKFRQADDWAVNWGGAGLSGIGEQDGPNIEISQTGYYTVSFTKSNSSFDISPIEVGPSYGSIGLIGSGTTGNADGWNQDIDMTPDEGGHIWTLDIFLPAPAGNNEIKFRADDDWAVNWGGPVLIYLNAIFGSATQDGPNIGIAPGDYRVTFNDITADYYLECLSGECTAFIALGGSTPGGGGGQEPDTDRLAIIGSATLTGWDNDIALNHEGDGLYTGRFYLTGGNEAKFRANRNWDTNWGAAAFPSGTGEPGGTNIPIAESGYYDVSFNLNTAEYSFFLVDQEFAQYQSMGIIGDATPGGWDNDTNLERDADNPNLWRLNGLSLVVGGSKFRAEGGWDNNWGAVDFPIGVGTPGGDNIEVDAEGAYSVLFDDVTGFYMFTPAG